jgi:Zn-dependent protease with chaperone function
MHFAIYFPLLASAVLGACAPRLSRCLPPATATRLLATAGAVLAAATSFVLGVLAFTLVAELGPVARLGSWSTSELDAVNPIPDFTAAAAAAAVCVLTVVLVRAAVRRVRATLAARRLCAQLGGGPGDLIVVDGPHVEAFALPALRGRIVASRPLLAALPAAERRAVLAHETAHLRHHHHTYRLAAELAAAVNPALRPLVDAVEYATERWADEAAARTVGDRTIVARALARCALQASQPRQPRPWAAAALHAVTDQSRLVRRVEALLAPAPRRRPMAVAAVAALLLVTMGTVLEAQQDTEQMFENASVTATPSHGATSSSNRGAIHRQVPRPEQHSL